MDSSLRKQLLAAHAASRVLANIPTSKKNVFLKDLATALRASASGLLRANARDLSKLPRTYKLGDRLRLTRKRIEGMATGVATVARLQDPVGVVLERTRRPNGLVISRESTPIGVIGMIYEARPNVTVEVASLTIKSGNAVVLKGGRDAYESNRALVQMIRSVLRKHGMPVESVSMIDPRKAKLSQDLMTAQGYVDVLIPRGGQGLIRAVRRAATVPTIETGAGVCHTYVERSARLDSAASIVVNAKTRRPSVCNALDTLLIDRSVARDFLKKVAPQLERHGVILRADTESFRLLRTHYPAQLLRHAQPKDFGHEFLSLQAAVKIVGDWHEGVRHVQTYTSGHSECIVTENRKAAQAFVDTIDAAAVYVNAATSFTDGFEFGLGGEIGISTQKLHARGPMALRELTTYKWIVRGTGQIRRP